jgi:hypothetical protein
MTVFECIFCLLPRATAHALAKQFTWIGRRRARLISALHHASPAGGALFDAQHCSRVVN